jgi:hypothetical protein
LLPLASPSTKYSVRLDASATNGCGTPAVTRVNAASGTEPEVVGAVAGAVAGGLASASVGLEPAVDPTWLYGRFVTRTLIRVYAMRMAAVFMISTTTLSMRFQIVPRWLAILGFVGAGVLLLTVGSLVWVELIFPVWVLILSVNLLVTSLRRSQPAAAAS